MCDHSILPDSLCFSWLLLSCHRVGDSIIAKELFTKMKKNSKFKMNLIQCTQLMKLFENDSQIIIDLLNVMDEQNIYLDLGGILSLIKISSNIKSLNLCKRIEFHISKNIKLKSEIKIQNSLISMYSKCGSLNDSISIFNEINDSHKDVITWTFND